MTSALPGFEAFANCADDVVLTPDEIAADVIRHFNPSGLILDPCAGAGAFRDKIPGCLSCEIRDGQDFFKWERRVDWIISNPPYSIFSEFLRHSFKVADNIVYLIPINKVFNSDRMIREIWEWGGVPSIYVVAAGGALNFPIGFAIGAVHFQRGYTGGTQMKFR